MEQFYPFEEAKVAEMAAREAGRYLVSKLGNATIEYQKAPRDNLLDVDLEAERLILSRLRENFPEYGILSEEAGEERIDASRYWIVDPLDGSTNFLHGSPVFAISIALVINVVTVLGVIYLPARDEMFVAIRGQGAKLNGELISHSQAGRVEDAIIYIGEFERLGNIVNREQVRELTIVADHASRIRITGTSCTDLVWVACGRADAFIMHGGNPWDVKAGRVLLEEVGGKVSSHKYKSGTVLTVYSNGIIHQELTNLLSVDTEFV